MNMKEVEEDMRKALQLPVTVRWVGPIPERFKNLIQAVTESGNAGRSTDE